MEQKKATVKWIFLLRATETTRFRKVKVNRFLNCTKKIHVLIIALTIKIERSLEKILNFENKNPKLKNANFKKLNQYTNYFYSTD